MNNKEVKTRKELFGRKAVERLKKSGEYKEVKILCRYCDLKDVCPLRERKETYEKTGVVTRCPFTPNGRKTKHKNK